MPYLFTFWEILNLTKEFVRSLPGKHVIPQYFNIDRYARQKYGLISMCILSFDTNTSMNENKDLLSCGNHLVSCYHKLVSHCNELACHYHDLLSCGNDLISCGNNLITHGNDLVSCGNYLLTRCNKIKKVMKKFYTHF